MTHGPVDIRPLDLAAVRRILDDVLPFGAVVWVFGSRVKWTTRDGSDLDLAVDAGRPLTRLEASALSEQFEESDLPYKVDVVDWHSISDSFRAVIEQDKVLLPKVSSTPWSGMAGEALVSSETRSWLYHPVFPEQWERRALYSLARWVNGLAFRDIQFSQAGKPVIKIAEIKAGISDQTKFTEQVFDEAVHVRAGDLLFSWSGQPETSIDVFWWRGPDGWLNQHSFRVTPAEGIDPTFFFYLLRYLKPSFIGIARNKQTTGLGHVTKRDLENIEAAYPDLCEQRAIAHILGTLDDKVELNRRMNETLEAMARALFKSWFVDFDPVRAKAEGRDPGLPQSLANLFPDSFEDSELGEVPNGWPVGPLESVMVLQRGFDLPSPKRTLGTYPVLAASGPSGTHNELKVRGPGVTTGRSGVLGKVFYVHDDFWPLITSLWVKEFRHSMPAYAFHLLRGLDLGLFNAGSAVPTLKRNHVHNLPTLLPPMDLIAAFERSATASLKRQKLNEDQSRTLAALRDTLLPKLISGDLRVKDAERFIERAV